MPRPHPIDAEVHIERLHREVERVFGRPLAYPKDCESLAQSIIEQTARSISASTLKRVFGFTVTNSMPSTYTLDTLAQYAGYAGWGSLLQQPAAIATAVLPEMQWEVVHERSRTVSGYTLEAIKRKSGLRYENTIDRAFFRAHLDAFLHSPCTATAFVAPGGYGKSIGLARAVERLWLGEGAPHGDDAAWFVQASNLSSLEPGNFDLRRWLLAQMGLTGYATYRAYFHAHPEARKGRLLLIIDALDEHAVETSQLDELLSQLVDVIGSSTTPWFRVILSMRTATWGRLLPLVREAAAFREQWFKVQFEPQDETPTNVPLLTPEEVKQIIQQTRNDTDVPHELPLAPVPDTLRHPYYLQLFLQAQPQGLLHPTNELALIEQFLHRRMYSSPQADEQVVLLQVLIRLTDYGCKAPWVDKHRLTAALPEDRMAYRRLVSFGILVEERTQTLFGKRVTRVQFGHQNLFEILVARHWIEQAGGITTALLQAVAERYADNALRLPLLTWIIAYALRAQAFDALRSIFALPLSPLELKAIGRTLGCALRSDDATRNTLAPYYARHPAGRTYYFESFVDQDYLVKQFMTSLRHYLNHSTSPHARIFGHAMLLLGHLLHLDAEDCHRQARLLEALSHEEALHPLPLGRSIAYRLLYHHHLCQGIPAALLEETIRLAASAPHAADDFRGFPCYHLFVMEALNLCGYIEEACTVMHEAQRAYPQTTDYRHRTTFYQMLHTQYALTYLKNGATTRACKLFKRLQEDHSLKHPTTYPTFYYSHVHLLFLSAEIALLMHRAKEAQSLLHQAMDLSRKLGFRFFEVQGLLRLGGMMNGRSEPLPSPSYLHQANAILEERGFPVYEPRPHNP